MRNNLRVMSAVLTILGLTFITSTPANAVPFVFPNPNPAGTTGVYNYQLPDCQNLTGGTKPREMAGQGWSGDWQLPIQLGLRKAWSPLLMPCYSTGASGPRVMAGIYALDTSGTFIFNTPTVRLDMVKYWCNGGTFVDSGTPVTFTGGIPGGTDGWNGGAINSATGICTGPNSRLTRIDVNWSGAFNGSMIVGSASWRAELWTTGDVNHPPANFTDIPMPSGEELPVVCPYAIDTTDILSSMSSFFTTFGPWVVCLFSPAGWDRAGEIPSSWEQSGISRTGDVIAAAIPSAGNIVCGEILDMELGWINFSLSSCGVANSVPGWIKIAIASVCIIAMLMLCIKRVQWAVVR